MSVSTLTTGFDSTIRVVGAGNGVLFPDGTLQETAYQGGGGGNVFQTLTVEDELITTTQIANTDPVINMSNGVANDNFISISSNTDSTAGSDAGNTIQLLVTPTGDVKEYGAQFAGGFNSASTLGDFAISSVTDTVDTLLMTGSSAGVSIPVGIANGLDIAGDVELSNGILTINHPSNAPVPVNSITSTIGAIDDGVFCNMVLQATNAGITNGAIFSGGTNTDVVPAFQISVISNANTYKALAGTTNTVAAALPFTCQSTLQVDGVSTFVQNANFSANTQFNNGITTYASTPSVKFTTLNNGAGAPDAVLNNLAVGATSVTITFTFTDTFITTNYAVILNARVTDGTNNYPAVFNFVSKSTNNYSFNVTNIGTTAFSATPSLVYTLLAFGN